MTPSNTRHLHTKFVIISDMVTTNGMPYPDHKDMFFIDLAFFSLYNNLLFFKEVYAEPESEARV